MSYPITDLQGIDGQAVAALRSAGIRSTGALLEKARTVRGRKLLAEKTQFDEKQLLCWANGADRMRVKGVSKEYALLLHYAGVDTVKELSYRNARNLAAALVLATEKHGVVRFLPSEKVVERWIEHAMKLPLKISYRLYPHRLRSAGRRGGRRPAAPGRRRGGRAPRPQR